MRLLALALACMAGLTDALYTFEVDDSYNASIGLRSPVAWGTQEMSRGMNLTSNGWTAGLAAPLKWIMAVDASGTQSLGIAAPQGRLNTTNATSWFDDDESEDTYTWAIDDGCVLDIPLSMNSIRNAQNDPGDCSTALSDNCVFSMVQSAYTAGNSNSWRDWGDICESIESAVRSLALAKNGACSDYFDGAGPDNFTVTHTVLDGEDPEPHDLFNATSKVMPGWQITPLWSGRENFSPSPSNTTQSSYADNFRSVKAMMLVVEPPNTQGSFASYLNCVRVTNSAPNATVPPALPAGTRVPRYDPDATSHEKKVATIASAAVLGGLSIIGLVVLLVFRFRRAWRSGRERMRDLEQRLAAAKRSSGLDEGDEKAMLDGVAVILRELDAAEPEPTELVGRSRSELVGSNAYKELDDSSRKELAGCEVSKELEADGKSVTAVDTLDGRSTSESGTEGGWSSPTSCDFDLEKGWIAELPGCSSFSPTNDSDEPSG